MKVCGIFLVVSSSFFNLGGMDSPFSTAAGNLPRIHCPFTAGTPYEYFIALKKIEKLVWDHVEEKQNSRAESQVIQMQAKFPGINSHSLQTLQGLMLRLSFHSLKIASIISPWGEYEIIDWTARPDMQWISILAALQERLQIATFEPANECNMCKCYTIGAIENKNFPTVVLRKKEDNIHYDDAQENWRAMEKKYNDESKSNV